jgi:hypothetical protein
MHTGAIGSDGRSVLPPGVIDHASQQHTYTPEQEAKAIELFSGLGFDTIKAKYKLEVMFVDDRSVHKPFGGVVSAWTNGGYFNGGGDETVYFCPIEHSPGVFCSAPITGAFLGGSVAICEKCRRPSVPRNLVGQFFARLPFQHWASTLTNMFRLLGSDADLRVGLMTGDIMGSAALAMGRGDGDALTKLRTERKWVVYPLASIIKDTSTGSEVEARIRAFLSA